MDNRPGRKKLQSGTWHRFALHVALGLGLAATGARAQPGPPSAARLRVAPEAPSIDPGQPIKGTVSLVGLLGDEVRAPGELRVHVEARQLATLLGSSDVTIAAGASSASFELRSGSAGIVEVRAQNNKMLPGLAFVRVRGPLLPNLAAPHPVSANPSAIGAHPDALGGTGHAGPIPGAARPGMNGEMDVGVGIGLGMGGGIGHGAQGDAARHRVETAAPGGDRKTSAPAHPAEEPQAIPHVQLFVSPERPTAAPADPATVQLFLVEGVARSDIRVNLHASSGVFDPPMPLVIRKGEDSVRASLKLSQPDKVQLDFVGATPRAQLDGAAPIRVEFRPAVSRLDIQVSDHLSVGDDADLQVQLLDPAGRAIHTDVDRVVTLSAPDDIVGLKDQKLTIPANSFFASTKLHAKSTGRATLTASSDELFDHAAVVEVKLPLGPLGASAAGGLIGGILAAFRKKRRHVVRRGLTGVVTGFLLYWAVRFGGLLEILSGSSLDVLGCFAIGTLGGWLGTEVFSIVLRRFGLLPEDAKHERSHHEKAGQAEA